MSEYTIHGGDKGKKRLEVLSRTVGPGTENFLKAAGLHTGINCLDLGCGGGNVTLTLTQLIGPAGHITGMDIDARKIQLATESAVDKQMKNLVFKVHNAYEPVGASTFDLVYSRFLLSHLNNPGAVIQHIWQGLKPGGTLLIEDTDFSGHFSYPDSDDFKAYVSLYQQLLGKRGADANIGQKLAGMLQKAGFEQIEFQVSQPVHMSGEGKQMAEITFEGIAEALISEGLVSAEGADRIYTGLVEFRKRSDSLISLPRIFQLHARRPMVTD